jgi:sugar/nucleoside kinase (ribokinase family)
VPVEPRPSETPIDTTGAGDAFDAAFIAARMRGLSTLEACRWGNAAGRMAVRVVGPRAALSIEAVRAGAALL